MANVVKQARDAFENHVKKGLLVLPVGSYLCVHEDVKDHPSGDTFKIVFEVASHNLETEDGCEIGGRRTVFGPKGE